MEIRIVDQEEHGLGWAIRKGLGQPPILIAPDRDAAVRMAAVGLAAEGGTLEIYGETGQILERRTIGHQKAQGGRHRVDVPPETGTTVPAVSPTQPEPARVAATATTAAESGAHNPVSADVQQAEKYPAKAVFAAAAVLSLLAWFGRPEDVILQLLTDRGISDDTKNEMAFIAGYALPATLGAGVAFIYWTRDKATAFQNKVGVVIAIFLATSVACRALQLGYPVEITWSGLKQFHGNPLVVLFEWVGAAYLNAYGLLTVLAAIAIGVWAGMVLENKWGKFVS